MTCQRCGALICPDCMRTASVGFHCPSCAAGAPGGRTVHPLRQRTGDPTVTRVIIAVNAVVFFSGLVSGVSATDLFARGGGEMFTRFALWGPLVDQGEWWRLIGSAFLHAGLLHLAFNMFLAWMLGQQLEKLHGPLRFLGLYAGSLAGGSLGVMLLEPDAVTVGASGAVFGLMGATFVHQRRRGVNPFSTGIGGLVLINLLLTFGRPGISIGGHLGGLIGGAVLAWLVDEADRRRAPRWLGTAVPLVFAVVCLVAGVWAAGHWMDPLLG